MQRRLLLLALPLLAALALPGSAAAQSGRIKLEDASGRVIVALTPEGAGYAVEDGTGKKLGRVKVENDRVKVADASGKPAFKVKQKEGGYKLYREPAVPGSADVELAAVWPEPNGLLIKDASDRELYKGKRDGGHMKVAGRGGVLWTVKEKPDGVEVEAAGKRLVKLTGLRSAPAAVLCAAPTYGPLEKAAVLAYAARLGR